MAKTAAVTKPVAASGTPTKKAGKAKDAPSTAVAVRKPAGGAVVDIAAMQAKLREQAQAMAERTAPASGIKIQVTQDKKFKLPDGQQTTELTACVVDFITIHNFYEGAFDKNNIQPPVCFAIGSNPKDMAPSDNSPKKQAETCQVCPMNAFGSDGEGKACKNGRRLAVLPPTDDGTSVEGDADLWTLDVSPTAIKGWDGFVKTLANTWQLPPMGFLVDIGFDDTVTYAKLAFSNPRPLTQDGIAAAFGRQAEAQEILKTEPDVSGYNPAAAAGKKPAARGAARR